MIGLIKNKPWKNLIDTLTLSIPFPLFFIFIFYFILFPTLVFVSHRYEVNTAIIKHGLNVIALLLVLFVPKYLRSGDNLLSLHDTHKKGIFPFLYHTVLKVGGIFSVIFFTYIAILISMLILVSFTGISQSQEIPDLTHMTVLMTLYASFSAGLTEEVWRVVGLILILWTFKKIFGNNWNNTIIKIFSLIFAVTATSFTFGWLHTFGYSDSYFSIPIILQIGVVGIILSGIYLITRRIWYAIFFHTVFDFVSISAHANEFVSEEALTSIITEQKFWLVSFGWLALFSFICFLLSIYFLRFSKGANKNLSHQ